MIAVNLPPAPSLEETLRSLIGRAVQINPDGSMRRSDSLAIGDKVRAAVLPYWQECPPLFGELCLGGIAIVTFGGWSLRTIALEARITSLVEEIDRIERGQL